MVLRYVGEDILHQTRHVGMVVVGQVGVVVADFDDESGT